MKTLLSLVAALALPCLASAQNYIANLTPDQEPPPIGTRAGSGIFNLILTGTTMTISGSFSGISGNFSDAHIHGASAPGVNSGVLYSIVPYLTLGADNKSGTLNGQITMIATPNGRNIPIAQQLADLRDGLWYFNIHSSAFAGGEIRGQILPVPEPSTWALLGLGVGGLALRHWRRRNR